MFGRRSADNERQNFRVLKEAETGIAVAELCPTRSFGYTTFYAWRSTYSGMNASSIRRLKELEEENDRLRKMYAEEILEAEVVPEVLEKE